MGFKIGNRNKIYLTKGDTARFAIELLDADGDEYTLTGTDTVYFTVKDTAASAANRIQKTLTADSTEMVIEIEPSDTAGMDVGEYVYDIQITKDSGRVYTLIPEDPGEPLAAIILMEEVTS